MSSDRNKLNLLEGKVGEWGGLTSKIVRVFLSSTFTDMSHERNALMENVYPQLKQYCRENYNIEFQVVDMRWGVHKDAYNDHMVIDLCLKEIENCQRLSIGPNFVVLIGQKYGFRPLPCTIPKVEFESLLTTGFSGWTERKSELTGGKEDFIEAQKDEINRNDDVELKTVQFTETNSDSLQSSVDRTGAALPENIGNKLQHICEVEENTASTITSDTVENTTGDDKTPEIARTKESSGDTNKQRQEENTLLNTWYKLDENCFTPVYCLEPVYKVLATESNRAHTGEIDKLKVEAEWHGVCEKLTSILRKRAKVIYEKGLLHEDSYKKYYISVTEDEICHGILDRMKIDSENLQTLSVFRTIENMRENLKDLNSPSYIDMLSKDMVNDEAQNLLNDLKERVEQSLSKKDAILKFQVKWEVCQEIEDQLHRKYIQEFCTLFSKKLRSLIDSAMVQRGNVREDHLMTEVLQHAETRKTWSNIVIGRESEIEKLRAYLTGRSNQPMFVFGVSGCGKTALMAKAAQMSCDWKPNAMVLYRFLGTTPKTSTVGALIESLSNQISILYGKSRDDIPTEYTQLIPYFHQLLKLATKEKPLIIILDALDQLSPDRNAHRLVWLPMKLPLHVKLVMSAIPTVSNIGGTIKETIKHSDNLLEIQPLGERASLQIIMAKLREVGRTISQRQQALLTGMFQKCSLPLFCKLTFENVRHWKSYNDYDKTYTAADVESAVNNFFGRLEAKHGQILVSRYLSYLTAAKNGLSDVELEDILSLDDDVLNEVFFFWIPPIRRIPPSILTHIKVDLHSYVITREANDVHVNSWYHRKFAEVARRRYLQNIDAKKIVHSNLADYFSGIWGGGIEKPFEYNEKQAQHLGIKTLRGTADRKVPIQPLVFESKFDNGTSYNLRKLSELPRHLIASNRLDDLSKNVVFNYRWLHTKLKATHIRLLRNDLRGAATVLPGNESLQYLLSIVRLSSSALQENPDSLASEIMCRLLWYYDSHADLRHLIQQCESTEVTESVLVPVEAALDPPSDALIYSFEGHNSAVTDIQLTTTDRELFSIARDGSICQWDMATAEILRRTDTGEIDDGRPANLMLSKDNTYIAVSTISSGIKFQSIYITKTGELIDKWQTARTAVYHNEMISKTLAILDGKVLYLDDCSVLHHLYDYEEFKYYVVVDIVPNEQHLLMGLVEETAMFNIKTCEKIISLRSENISSSIILTRDNTTAIVGYSGDCLIKCFDIDTMSQNFGNAYQVFSVENSFPKKNFENFGNFSNEVSEMAISQGESKIVAVIKHRYPCLWSLLTGEGICMNVPEQEIPELFYWTSFNYDSKLVVSVSSSSKIHIWSADNGDLLTCHIAHNNKTKELLCGLTANIAASVAICENVIKIWDIGKLLESQNNSSSVNKTIKQIILPPGAHSKAFLISTYPHGNYFYLYINYFTLEILDLITKERRCIMPFEKYGNCCELVSSYDGSVIVYMVNNITNRQFTVLNLTAGDVVLSRSMPGCTQLKLSKCGMYLLCVVKKERKLVTRLFDCQANKKLITFRHSDDAGFLSASSVLYLTNDDLYEYRIDNKTASKYACKFPAGIKDGKLHVISAGNVVIVTTAQGGKRIGYVIYTKSQQILATMKGLSKGGLTDVSDNGEIAVDTELKVFNVDNGSVIHDFAAKSGPGGANMIRLSPSGEYVIWHEKNIPDTIKVARISTGQVYASCNLHSNINSLAIHKQSEIVAIGTNEGHFHLFKIKEGSEEQADENFDTLVQRKQALLGLMSDDIASYIHPVNESVIKDLTRIYRVSNIKHLELEEVVEEKPKSRVCTIM